MGSEQDLKTQRLISIQQMTDMVHHHIKAGGTFLDLMEQASGHVAVFIQETFAPCKILILCGPGDNGGEAYGVARLLQEKEFDVTVAMDTTSDFIQSPEAKAERNAWHGTLYDLDDVEYSHYALIVDGLFGTGLKDSLRGLYLKVVQQVNESSAKVIAIDIPSGVCADTGHLNPESIQADYTISCQYPKKGHYLGSGKKKRGKLILCEIGMTRLS